MTALSLVRPDWSCEAAAGPDQAAPPNYREARAGVLCCRAAGLARGKTNPGGQTSIKIIKELCST